MPLRLRQEVQALLRRMKPTPQERHRAETIELAEQRMPSPRCELALLGVCNERWPGDLDADHVLEQRWIKSHPRLNEVLAKLGRTLDDLLADGRNGMLLCRAHNEAKYQGTIRVPRALLPVSVEVFALETEMTSRLDAHFLAPPSPAAQALLRA